MSLIEKQGKARGSLKSIGRRLHRTRRRRQHMQIIERKKEMQGYSKARKNTSVF